MKKKKYKVLLTLQILLIICLVACQPIKKEDITSSQEDLRDDEGQEKSHNKKSKADSNEASIENQKLPLVKGAMEGSISSYVKDREVWKDFISEKLQNQASGPIEGVHFPEITLDSKDAKEANIELNDILEKLEKSYEEFQKTDEAEGLGIYSAFSVYQDDKLLSILLETSSTLDGYVTNYYIYNFSLPDGKRIEDLKLLGEMGLDEDDIIPLMEDSIVEEYKLYSAKYDNNVDDEYFMYGEDYYLGMTLENLWDSYDVNQNKVFINEVGKPMFVCEHFTSAGSGEYTSVDELIGKPLNYYQYSETYVKMARALGENPYDEKKDAIIIYLGNAWQEDNLKDILIKLNAWQAVYYDYEDPNILLNIKENTESKLIDIKGQEYYLLVPKWKNASVSLKELEATEDGELKEVDNYYLDDKSLVGPTLICQNESEIYPNAKIFVRYRDDITGFSPSISQKDGGLMVPENIIDGKDLLDWDNLKKDYMYSYSIYEKILSIMGRG